MTQLQNHKTKIVCTIGPASDSPEMLEQLIRAGMNIARLNFSHGEFELHAEVIEKIRAASRKTGKRVAIMADLPGPKMRIGDLAEESVLLRHGARFTLTTEKIIGDAERVFVTMQELPAAVCGGDTIFLNDGLIELRVEEVRGCDIHCRVIVGGPLRSRKGVNIPGIDLGTSAFTPRDRECMQFALEHGVDAIAQSFVSRARDVEDVRAAAADMGHHPFIIAKIERASVRDHLDEILGVTDGVMVARGDLGVEIPIAEIAEVQKHITAKANLAGRPVITATQMLESMVSNRRPTRAESTDVANAILDGTDCVMLSEESAVGRYPLDAVKMLASISRAIEPKRPASHFEMVLKPLVRDYRPDKCDLISASVGRVIEVTDMVSAVMAPTASGAMARSLTRFRLPVWILAPTSSLKTCRELAFSWGVHPVLEKKRPANWTDAAAEYVKRFNLGGNCCIRAQGPSRAHPDQNYVMEIIDLKTGEK